MRNYLKKYGKELIEKGFDIVPIKAGTKMPRFKGWQNTEASVEDVDTWLKTKSNTGIGILTKHFPAIDIDVRDPEVIAEIEKFLFEELLVDQFLGQNEIFKRTGQPPKCLYAFRTDEPFKKLSSKKYVDFFGDEHQIEILGDGQQYVAYHIHPDTNEPYSWTGNEPANVDQFDFLPYLTREQGLELISFFEDIVPAEWEVKSKGDTKAGELAADLSLDEDIRILENYRPPLDITDKKAARMLAKVDPNSFEYDQWLKVGMACYHQWEGNDHGFEKWHAWSSRSEKHDDTDMRMKYDSFGTDLTRTNPVTFAYVLKLADKAHQARVEAKLDKERASFRLIHASDVMAKLGPIDWQVKHYIEADTTGILFGDPGSFKSFIALDLCLHCAAGNPWHGNDVKKGSVIYVAGEGHGGFARRLAAWEKHTGTEIDDLPVYFSQQAASLYDEESALVVTNAIDRVVEETEAPAMIVIDTLARNFGPGDENSTADMNVFVDNVDKLLRAKYRCTVLIVHHTGHANKERARGSMALKGALDYEYRLEKQFDNIVKLTCTKMKDAVEPDETWFEGVVVPVDLDIEDEEFEGLESLAFDKIDAPVESEVPLKGKQLECYNFVKELLEASQGDDMEPAGMAKKELQKALIDAEISKTNDAARKLCNTLLEKEFFYENQGFIFVSDDF